MFLVSKLGREIKIRPCLKLWS